MHCVVYQPPPRADAQDSCACARQEAKMTLIDAARFIYSSLRPQRLAAKKSRTPPRTRVERSGCPPAPCTLRPAPYTLRPAPCTLHPAPCTTTAAREVGVVTSPSECLVRRSHLLEGVGLGLHKRHPGHCLDLGKEIRLGCKRGRLPRAERPGVQAGHHLTVEVECRNQAFSLRDLRDLGFRV